MNKKQGINFGVGKKCIIRSYSANSVWLEAIEIIPCTKSAIKSIEEVEDAQAKIEAE